MGTLRWCVGVCLLIGVGAAWAEDGGLRPGDMATVKVEKTPIKLGQQVVAWLQKGQSVKIWAVQGRYALIPFSAAGGKQVEGYVAVADLEPPQRTETKAARESGYNVDDEVVVVGKDAKLMMGKDVLGTLAPGTRLVIKRMNDKWLGVNAPISGKETWGWVHSREVDYPRVGDRPPDKAPEKDADRK
jgi:hypothetical protein